MIDVLFKVAPLEINLGFETGTIIEGDIREHYHGSYEVTPMVIEQSLETNNKIMDDDVTIFAIPYSEVSNPSGGKTATIG